MLLEINIIEAQHNRKQNFVNSADFEPLRTNLDSFTFIGDIVNIEQSMDLDISGFKKRVRTAAVE